MRDHSEQALTSLLESQRKRLEALSADSVPTKAELSILECFWNPHFHTMRDWVPLAAIVDNEIQRLTSRYDSDAASALIRARVKTLMALGFIGDEIVEFHDGAQSNAKLWLTAKGASHFAAGVPHLLRSPLTFARRHLSLFQLVAVFVTIFLAIATFAARLLGWVG